MRHRSEPQETAVESKRRVDERERDIRKERNVTNANTYVLILRGINSEAAGKTDWERLVPARTYFEFSSQISSCTLRIGMVACATNVNIDAIVTIERTYGQAAISPTGFISSLTMKCELFRGELE